MKIYLALAIYAHEGFGVIDAYATREAAEARIASCRAHMEKRPPYPKGFSGFDTPEWRAFMVESDKWGAIAPEGFERGDDYEIDERDLIP